MAYIVAASEKEIIEIGCVLSKAMTAVSLNRGFDSLVKTRVNEQLNRLRDSMVQQSDIRSEPVASECWVYEDTELTIKDMGEVYFYTVTENGVKTKTGYCEKEMAQAKGTAHPKARLIIVSQQIKMGKHYHFAKKATRKGANNNENKD